MERRNMKTKIWKVKIYEQPYEYTIEAKNKSEAEYRANIQHNGGTIDEIYKIEVKEIKTKRYGLTERSI